MRFIDRDGKDASLYIVLFVLFSFMMLGQYRNSYLFQFLGHITISYTVLTGPLHQRAVIDSCHGNGTECSKADLIGNDCLAVIATEGGDLDQNDTPGNAKKVRDCICDGPYWTHFNACHDCLVSSSLYPLSQPTDVAIPPSILSSSYCSPTAGRTDTRTIDGFMDQATYEYDIPLETGSPEQISSYFGMLDSIAAEETAHVTILNPSQISRSGRSGLGPLETGSPEQLSSHYASLASAAATDTRLLTALESASPITQSGPSTTETTSGISGKPKSSSITATSRTLAVSSSVATTTPAPATGVAPSFVLSCRQLPLLILSLVLFRLLA